MVFVPAVVVVAFYFEKKRAFATGIAVAGSGIGTFIFAPLTEFLIERYHWRGAFMITSGIMLNTVLCGAIFRPLNSENVNMYRSQRKRSHRQCHQKQESKKVTEDATNVQKDSEDDAKVVVEIQSETKPQTSYAKRMRNKIQQNISNLRLFRISETSNASTGENYESSSGCDSGDSGSDDEASTSSSSSTENTTERLSKSEPNLMIDRSKHRKTSSIVKASACDKKRTSIHHRHYHHLNLHQLSPLSVQSQANVSGRFIVARLARSTACIKCIESDSDLHSPRGLLSPTSKRRKSARDCSQLLKYHSVVPINSNTSSEVTLNIHERGRRHHQTHNVHHHRHHARCFHLMNSIPSSQDNSSGAEATVALLHSEKDLPRLSQHSPMNGSIRNDRNTKSHLKRQSYHFTDCNCQECSLWKHPLASQENPKNTIPSGTQGVNPERDITRIEAPNQPSQNMLPMIISTNSGSGSSIAAPLYNNRSSSVSDHGNNIKSVNSLVRGSSNHSGSDKFFFITGRQDMVYRGSLLRTGFFVSHGRSASCPEVCMTPSKRRRHTTEEKRGLFMSLLCCCCDDDSDAYDTCCLENTPNHVCNKKCQLKQMAARNFSLSRLVKAAVNRFNRMVDLSVFKSPVFAFFNLHTVFLYLSYDIPYVYGPVRAIDCKISDRHASILVAIIGIFSMIGQVVMGYLGDLPAINVTTFYNSMTAIAGCMILFIPSVTSFFPMSVLYAGYGFFISANFALTTVILVELLGMNRLTNAFGIVSLAQGIANLVGPPLAGWLSDQTMSYNLAFYGSGTIILISGLMLFLTPCLEKCDNQGSKKISSINFIENQKAKLQNGRNNEENTRIAINRADPPSDELVFRIECDESSEESPKKGRMFRSKASKTSKKSSKVDKLKMGLNSFEMTNSENSRLECQRKNPDIVITEVASVTEEDEIENGY